MMSRGSRVVSTEGRANSCRAAHRGFRVRQEFGARAVGSRWELDSLQAILPMPLRAVRLGVPLSDIQNRRRCNVTTGRRDDLREAARWIETSRGTGIEDVTVSNDRPIRDVVAEVLDWLGFVGTIVLALRVRRAGRPPRGRSGAGVRPTAHTPQVRMRRVFGLGRRGRES